MANTILSLLPDFIIGAEENEGDPQGQSTEGTEGTEGEENNTSTNSDSTQDDEGDDKGDNKSAAELEAIRLALANERKVSSTKEKELKALRAQLSKKDREGMDEAELIKADLEAAQQEAEANKTKAEKLAKGYLEREIRSAIIAEAARQKFIDTEDAISGVGWDLLTFSQDEEDPTVVTVDASTVAKAVKALATRKPHFINKGTDDGNATGSAFGGSRKGNQKEVDFHQLYPNL